MKYAIEILERERLKIKRAVLKVNRKREALVPTTLARWSQYDEDIPLFEIEDALDLLRRTVEVVA